MLTNNFKESVLSKKLLLIDEFIELRALGHTFDEIVKELGVSKVTLIRWNKKYYEEIDTAKKEMVRLTAEKIALKNSNLLSKFAELVISEYKKGKKRPAIDEVILKKFYRNVFLVYSRKMKDLYVKFNKDGVPDGVVIKWKDEAEDC